MAASRYGQTESGLAGVDGVAATSIRYGPSEVAAGSRPLRQKTSWRQSERAKRL